MKGLTTLQFELLPTPGPWWDEVTWSTTGPTACQFQSFNKSFCEALRQQPQADGLDEGTLSQAPYWFKSPPDTAGPPKFMLEVSGLGLYLALRTTRTVKLGGDGYMFPSKG